MFERCVEFFLNEPRRLVAAGSGLLSLSGFLVVLGLRVAIATNAISAVMTLGSRTKPVVGIADVWTGVPTWWIPESILGFGFALFLGVMGVWAIQVGRTYQRLLGH